MPVHDWTRVISGIFHDFHQQWIVEIYRALNGGLLPDAFYALSEQVAERPHPDAIVLDSAEEFRPARGHDLGGAALAVAEHPPQVMYTEDQEREIYARAADRVAVYHASDDRVVAFIEIVSPGNKHGVRQVQRFLEKLDAAIERGCHLLIIDVHPPGRHDPRGMHAAFWEYRSGEAHGVTRERPLGVSAYCAQPETDLGIIPRAYFQPTAVGGPLPAMPLFLTPKHYVNVPLEQTYMAAWHNVPQRWKRVIEAAAGDESSQTTDHEPRTTDTP